MGDVELDEKTIANETLKLMMHTFSMKNSCHGDWVESELKRFKTHRKKFYILLCIDSIEDCTLSDLEKLLLENRSTASIAVSKLYHNGLISKNQPDKNDDGRKVYFKVTSKGKELLKEFNESFIRAISMFYGNLSEENKKNFVNGIESLNKVLSGDENLIMGDV